MEITGEITGIGWLMMGVIFLSATCSGYFVREWWIRPAIVAIGAGCVGGFFLPSYVTAVSPVGVGFFVGGAAGFLMSVPSYSKYALLFGMLAGTFTGALAASTTGSTSTLNVTKDHVMIMVGVCIIAECGAYWLRNHSPFAILEGGRWPEG